MQGAMRGLADGLDPDSAYLSPDQVKEVEAGKALPAGDIGVELTRQYYLRVIAARDGSPAAKAGLRSGDYVRTINDKPTREMSVWEGTRALRGAPGSKVTLSIIRGSAADPHVVELTRRPRPRGDPLPTAPPAGPAPSPGRTRRRAWHAGVSTPTARSASSIRGVGAGGSAWVRARLAAVESTTRCADASWAIAPSTTSRPETSVDPRAVQIARAYPSRARTSSGSGGHGGLVGVLFDSIGAAAPASWRKRISVISEVSRSTRCGELVVDLLLQCFEIVRGR